MADHAYNTAVDALEAQSLPREAQNRPSTPPPVHLGTRRMHLKIGALEVEADSNSAYVSLPFIGAAFLDYRAGTRGRTYFDTDADLQHQDGKGLTLFAGTSNVAMGRAGGRKLTPLWLATGAPVLVTASVAALATFGAWQCLAWPFRSAARLLARAK